MPRPRDRVWALAAVRLVAVAALVVLSWLSSDAGSSPATADSPDLVTWLPAGHGTAWTWPILVAYLAGTTAAGLLARGRSRPVRVVSAGVVVATDAVCLQHAVAALDGEQPVELVLAAYLVAVCLLVSWRLGLTAAVAQSAAALVAMPPPPLDPASAAPLGLLGQSGVLSTQALIWLVVLTTVLVASLDERELRRRGREAESLQTLAVGLHEDGTEESVAARALRFAVEDTGCRRAGVVRQHRDALELVRGHEVAAAPHLAEGATSSALTLAATAAGPTLTRSPDPLRDPWLSALLPGSRGLVLARLDIGLDRRLWLVAEPGGRHHARRGRRVAAVLGRVAATTALALSRVELLASAQAAASVDPLTGVANRRTLDELLVSLTERFRRSGRGFAVVMTDVDRFKSINDSLGHHAGDQVLRQVAAALRSQVRSHEVVARYGGEEFAVVLPDTGGEDAVALAERLRLALHEISEPVTVTASFGVAVVPRDASDGRSATSVADAALLRAKRQGRDRVVAAFADGEPRAGAATRPPAVPPAPREPSWRSAGSPERSA